ncbi:MAG TPA: NAD(P)/FAD-dependent oxidoreductase [Burkholderiales bacterium]
MKKVLIAGAGPVGLTAAHALERAGIEVAVFERESGLAEDLRASTWHPPTLDLLSPLGLTEDIISGGLRARYTQHRDRKTGAIAEFDMELLRGETNHPYRVQYEQFKYTNLVYGRLQAGVRFGAGIASVFQNEKTVEVTLDDGSRHKGDYLIGADGAGSAVRRAIGVDYEGFTFPERFFVVSTPFDFAAVLERLCYVNYIADTEEFCVLLKVPGLWRCLFPTQEESDEEVLASAERKLQGVFKKDASYETMHRTLYRVHQRVATRYRAGRVFLAGDAAHINNPLGGMGMNGGLHDALRLSQILINGENLESYEAERRPVAIEYINANTARNRKLMAERDPDARRQAQDEMCRIAADPVAAKAFLMKSSMIETLRRRA